MPSFQFRRIDHFDNMEMFSSENESDYFPFHFHDYFCVSLITKGTEILRNTEQEFIAPAGTISITQANEVHRNYSLSESGYSYKTVYLNPEILQHVNKGRKIEMLDRVIYDRVLFQQMLGLFDRPADEPAIWEEAFRHLCAHGVRPSDKDLWSSTFYRMDEIIESYPNKPIDTDWLSRKFCMSKYHFIREFKKAKGVTPQTYIMLYRLGNAKKMLLDKVPIRDIAYLTGFSDPSHFTNRFKKYFGISPSGYTAG